MAAPAWAGFAPGYARYRRLLSAPPLWQDADALPEDLWTFHDLRSIAAIGERAERHVGR